MNVVVGTGFYEKTVKFNTREECGLTWYEYGYTSTRTCLADMVFQSMPAVFYFAVMFGVVGVVAWSSETVSGLPARQKYRLRGKH